MLWTRGKKSDFDPVTQRQLLIMSNNVLAVRKSALHLRDSLMAWEYTHDTFKRSLCASPFMPYCEKWDRWRAACVDFMAHSLTQSGREYVECMCVLINAQRKGYLGARSLVSRGNYVISGVRHEGVPCWETQYPLRRIFVRRGNCTNLFFVRRRRPALAHTHEISIFTSLYFCLFKIGPLVWIVGNQKIIYLAISASNHRLLNFILKPENFQIFSHVPKLECSI